MQLAARIPIEQRQGHRSFIAPVRLVTCVDLFQERSGDWLATLSVAPSCTSAEALLAPPPAVGPAAAPPATFAELVMRVLERNGGTVSLSALGEAIPRAQRPRHSAKMLPLISAIAGLEVMQNARGTTFVRLREPDAVSAFAALVRGHLERAGGRMSLPSLSALIPRAHRLVTLEDRHLKPLAAFKKMVSAAMGGAVHIGGKRQGSIVVLLF